MRGSVALLVLLGAAGGCGEDAVTGPDPVGTLRVAIATAGADLDLDGYGLTVDDSVLPPVGTFQTVVVPGLSTGPHDVTLTGVAANCGVDGTALRSVTIVERDTTRVAYAVTCQATGVKVTASTTGVDLDADGYQVSVDGAALQSLTALGSIIVTRLTPGPHTVALSGLSGNCTLSDDNPRAVVILLGEIIDVPFAVTCRAVRGAIAVSATTTGLDLDAYYLVVVPGKLPQPVPVNGTSVITGITPGTVSLTISDVAANCGLQGDNPRLVTVTAGSTKIDTAQTAFTAVCGAATGVVEVTAQTSGADYDLDGYTIRLDPGGSQALGVNTTYAYEGVGPGDHLLTLEGIASNCTVSGGDTRTVSVSVGGATRDTARATFDVTCAKTWALAYSRLEWSSSYGTDVSTIRASNATGTTQAAFMAGDAPAWLPDGTQLAYAMVSCDYYYYYYYYCYTSGLATLGTSGSGTDTLTTNGSDTDPAWRPDGGRLAFTRESALYLINPDGSSVSLIPTGVPSAHPSWSPNGLMLAFTCEVDGGNPDICVINADGTGLTRLTSDAARDVRPAWSPDGSRIVFVTNRYTGSHELALMNPDGSAVTRVSPGTGAIQPAWSADGTKIVYTAYTCDIYAGCTMNGLFVMNADGTGLTQITNGRDYGATWRP